MRIAVVIILAVFAANSAFATIPWPMQPFDQPHPLGNSYGEYQDYGGFAYLHPGIDILMPAGTEVYAVKAGWVKAVLTTSAELHWRVAIGDSAGAEECDGWLYAHLDRFSIAVAEGDHVDSGQYLGNIVEWTVADFHHLHFVKIRNSGLTWDSDWEFIGNPLDELVNIEDTVAPYFAVIDPDVKFRFCPDNDDSFFIPGAPISGDVDIVVRAQDQIGHPTWEVTPYSLGYEIYSDSVTLGPYVSFVFTGKLLWDQVTDAVFKRSGPCSSAGDYDTRRFYEIITNHDSDTMITMADENGKWATGSIPNDTYTVRAWAADRYGNVTWDSTEISTENYHDLSGYVTYTDGNPLLSGVTLTVPYSGGNTVSNSDGGFLLALQPAGRYLVRATRADYQPVETTIEVFSDTTIALTLTPEPYLPGDVNHDGVVNISDSVFLIAFIFGNGPYPHPWGAATEIDSSPVVNVSDAVYLIAYIFGGGPPPGGV